MTSTFLGHPVSYSFNREKTACRDSDVARLHGRPSQPQRSVLMRQSLRQERAAREKRAEEIKYIEEGKKYLVDEVSC